MLKQYGFSLAIAVIVVAALKLGVFQEGDQFSDLNQTFKSFLVPIILLYALLGVAFVIIAVKAPQLVTTRRLNLFAWVSGGVLAATFLIAIAYTKLMP